jgi:RNA polymerase sigma-70 factor (ECF subfamily)
MDQRDTALPQNSDNLLEDFLIKYRARTLTFTVFRVKDEEHALDILQDAMLGFVKVAHQYEQCAWLNLFYKILKRRISDFQRKQRWRNRLQKIIPFSHLKAHANEEHSWDDLHTYPENTQSNPVESYLAMEHLADDFERALHRLPNRQQEAYLLRQWQGMSVKETADIMGCSTGSVKTHLSRAMQSLKANLGEWMDE